MNVTLRQLAEWVAGEVVGDGEMPIAAARPLSEARAGDITFADERHLEELHHSGASAAIVPMPTPANGKPIIRVGDPLAAFVSIYRRLETGRVEPARGIHPLACIDASAVVGRGAWIGPFAVIGAGTSIGERSRIHSGAVIGSRCRLGDDVELHPHVVLYDGTLAGHRLIVHANAVIGSDGFGYRSVDGEHVKVPQFGHVEIGDDVEIGAGTTIDRGTFGPTRIGSGTKIDNLVQIGHNCQIGLRNIVVSQAGIAGSTRTGEHVIVAGQAGIRDHVEIGDRAVIGPQAGVTKDIGAGERVLGSPAIPEREFKLVTASTCKLPELRRLLMQLRRHVNLEDEP